MPDESAIAERLREARTARGLSVREWAELLGNDVKPGQVTDVERKKQRPTQGMLLGAVQNAGISTSWLLEGVGDMLAASEQPASTEDAIAVLRAATLKLAALKLDQQTMRAAHQWLVAIEMGDRKSLRQLAAAESAGVAREAARGYAAATIDVEQLTRVIGAVLAAADGAPKRPTPAVLARVTATLYRMAGRGLDVDVTAAAEALELAQG